MNKYPISSYNKYICLKASSLMVLISLYLIKPYIIASASVVYKGSNSPLDVFYPNRLIVSLEAAAAIPVLILLYAWTRRAPDASNMIKNICKNGKSLIITTASLQLCVSSSPLWLSTNGTMTRIAWIQALLYLLIILITALSIYMRDCFADFPESKQDSK